MTSPRFWTDPKDGATYPFAGRLTSDDFNAYLAGWRAMDYAIERNQATSLSGTLTRTSEQYSSIAIDEYYDQIIAMRVLIGSTSCSLISLSADGSMQTATSASRTISGEPTGGWTTTDSAIASDAAGTIVVGAATVNDSTDKVAVSTDGENFTVQSMNTGGAGVGVRGLIYEPDGGLFVAGLDGGGTGTTIETSSDGGVTWTARTNANSNAPYYFAVDGAGTVVATSNATTNKAVRSTDGGASWSEVTLPASAHWRAITYSKGLGKWFACDGTTNYASSSTGQTWATATFTNPLAAGNLVYSLGCLGNILVGPDAYGDIWISADGENFVRVADGISGTPTLRRIYASSAGWASVLHDGTDSTFRIGQIYHL